jgi:DNA polymerase-3 subunit alpha (Gram-positive type)
MLRGVEFLPVDIYLSHQTHFQKCDGKLLPPLAAVQGVGATAAKTIAAGRKEGEFASWEDLRLRCGVNKTVIEALAASGALDGLPESSQLSLF